MSIRRRLLIAAIPVVSAALLLAGCSSGAANPSSSSTANLSTLNIGFFSPGTSNTFAATVGKGGVDEAKKLGVRLTNVSGNFDVQTQVNQLQQAIQRKTYNAWVVVPLDANQECPIIKQGIAAGIKVVMAVSPTCGDSYPKGGTGIVAVQNRSLYNQWWDYILTNTKPGEIAVMTGGARGVDYESTIADDALDAQLKKHKGFTVVSNQALGYATDAAYQNAQALIKSHPNLKAIVSNYSGMTEGVINAIKQAGKTGSIDLYDFDGDKTIVAAIKSGDVTMTAPGMPHSEGAGAVKMTVDAWLGKAIPDRQLNPAVALKITDGPFITKKNVNDYTAEY
ncbi:MAG: sugar ABC transporter substrate-binding protein [Actinomycetota bacterium]